MFDFDTGGFQPCSPGATGGDGPWARLDLHAPQSYGTQVLRPFLYGFDTRAANFLLDKGDTLDEAFRRKDVQNSEITAKIMRPDPMGNPINMSSFNECWTFVLTLHIPNNVNSGILAAEGSKYLIFRGHCGDEPIAPSTVWMSTPVVNHDCRLIVHSREILRDNPKIINMFGCKGSTDVCGSVDVVDGCLNMCSNDNELYIIKPSDVLEYNSLSGVSGQTAAPSLCAITNDRKTVSADLKDPGLHLRQILQGIDAATEEARIAEFAPHGVDSFNGALSAATDTSLYKENVVSQLSMMNGAGEVDQGIEIKSVVTIGDIERVYPNLIIQPIQRDIPTMMDVVDQEGVSKKTVYSSMAASAISSIAERCGLASIAFMYTSRNPAKQGSLDTSDYRVKEDMCTLSCPPSDPNAYGNTLKAAVMLFMNRLHTDLEPFIKLNCGDFTMSATYSYDTEVRVDLQFIDDNNNSEGWFESPSRLSSLSSTSVGNKDNFMSNGRALNKFVMAVQGNTQKGALGLTAFDRPVDFGDDTPVESPLEGAFSSII